MFNWLFRIATAVTFVLMLIASLEATGQCLGEGVTVWLASGLLAGFFALFFAPAIDVFIAKQQRPAVVRTVTTTVAPPA
jgi:predicted cobalt transporter CbtA